MRNLSYCAKSTTGFTLVEMSIVLILLSLIAGSGLHALNMHIQYKRDSVTRERLREARAELLHFIQIYGRLPCPAAEVEVKDQKKQGGWEKRAEDGRCMTYDGFLPAQSLGLSETDGQGYAVDGWDRRANRIRYAVAQNMYLGNSGEGCSIKEVGNINVSSVITSEKMLAPLSGLYWGSTMLSHEMLRRFGLCVCSAPQCAESQGISAAAVVYTLGENAYLSAGELAGHADELENLNQDRFFVSHAPLRQFDDQVIWISSQMVWGALLDAKGLDKTISSELQIKEVIPIQRKEGLSIH